MGLADLDYCELHLKIVNYFSSLPYIDPATARDTRDLPYEAIEIQDDMYEPKRHSLSVARVTFPSLFARPELRTLLQLVKEGDRVEFYNYQPDCGDPVFAGYIPPGGITADEDGRVVLEIPSVLGRGQWERLRKIETFNTNTAGYLTRMMSAWRDVLNEDFDLVNDPNTSKAYSVVGTGGQALFQQGNLQLLNNGTVGHSDSVTVQPINPSPPVISLAPGNTVLIEALATPVDVQQSAPSTAVNWSLGLICQSNSDTIGANELLGENTGTSWWDVFGFSINYNNVVTYYPNGYQSPTGFLPNTPGGAQNQYSIILQVQANGTINAYFYYNFLLVQAQTLPAPRVATGWIPWVTSTINSSLAQVNIAKWRVRKLVPWLAPATRFNPQTTSNTYFQANADDYLTAMNNVCELDYSEYRVVYHAAPVIDTLELDAVGSLGNNASSTLGLLASTHPLQASFVAAGVDVAQFTSGASSAVSPPFRAEEGYNLAKVPVPNRKQINHANLIQRLGSGTLDGQNFYETWSVKETGKPQAVNASINPAPIAPQFPYFESVQNDDRTVLPATIKSLANNDLLQSTDTTPSLSLMMVEQLPYAFKYAPGDTIRVVTRSLLNNVDQDMRIMSVKHTSGSPTREITVGKHQSDPSMIAMLSMDMQEAWLYNQGGSSPLVVVYPFANLSVAAGAFGTDFQFPIDQFTGGTALVSAKLHWFAASGTAASTFVVCVANQTIDGIATSGVQFTAPNSTGSDSGLVDVTAVLNSTGNYHVNVKNVSGGTATIAGVFLILKVKIN